MDNMFISHLSWNITAQNIKYIKYRKITAQKADESLSKLSKYLHTKGITAPRAYEGKVINSFPFIFVHENASCRPITQKAASIIGKRYVSENHIIGIIAATPTIPVITLTNIKVSLSKL